MDEREPTRKEVDLLHFHGFHEVKGLEGSWQRGRAIPGHPGEPEGPYTLEKALQIVRDYQEIVDDD